MDRFRAPGRGRAPAGGRVLATVLFTDIVGSTELAVRLGDRGWSDLLARHHAAVRRELRRFGGREVDTAGDGFFATFEQPAQAVRCGAAIIPAVAALGLQVRAGVHTGEVELDGRGVGGIAVHIGARVAAQAAAGEVLVSGTVVDLVAGSELRFADRGVHALKGVPGEWRLHALERPHAPDQPPPAAEPPAAVYVEPSGRSRRPLVALLGAVAIVAAVAIAAAALAGAPAAAPVAAGPNTVAALDPATDRIARATAVGTDPAALAVAADAIWAGNVGDRTVSRIDGRTGAELARPGGAGVPSAIAVVEDTVFVADAFAGTLTTIDARSNAVTDSRSIRGRAIAVGFGSLWLSDHVAAVVSVVNPHTLAVEARIPLPAGSDPGDIVATADAVWVADRAANLVLRIDPASRAVTGSVALCCRPTAMAWALGSIWVTSADRDRLLRVDAGSGAVVRSVDVADGPAAVAGGESGWIWVAHPPAGTIWRLDETGERAGIIAVDGVPSGLAVGLDSIWVAIAGR